MDFALPKHSTMDDSFENTDSKSLTLLAREILVVRARNGQTLSGNVGVLDAQDRSRPRVAFVGGTKGITKDARDKIVHHNAYCRLKSCLYTTDSDKLQVTQHGLRHALE